MSQVEPYSHRQGEPRPLTARLRTHIDIALNKIEGPPDAEYIAAEVIKPLMRSWLEARRLELISAFRPASQHERENALITFLGSYTGAGRLSSDDLSLYLANADETLHGFPLWLIETTVANFRWGSAGNPAFVPTVPELTTEALRLRERWLKEASDIARLLRAKVIEVRTRAEAENDRIDAAVAAFKAGLPTTEEDEINRRINSIVMAAAADWQMAGNLKKRGMTSATLDERLAIASEYHPDPTGKLKWDSRKGPAGTGRPPEVTVAQMRAEAAEKAAKPVETAAETLARLSGEPLDHVIAKLAALPEKEERPT